MWSLRSMWRVLPLIALMTGFGIIAGCSSESSDAPSAVSSSPAAATTPVTAITLTMTDNKYDAKAFNIAAGSNVTVTTTNKGSAIHNFHVLDVKSTDGKDIATQLVPGGKSEPISFAIDKPGTYTYRCDVHPEMNGKLTVQ